MDMTAPDPRGSQEDINVSVFTGRLARNPEFYRREGAAVCDLLVACSRTRTHDGQLVQKTSYIEVKAVDAQAERCCQRLRKGSPVTVQGELDSIAYQTGDGKRGGALRVVAHEVTFADYAAAPGASATSRGAPPGRRPPTDRLAADANRRRGPAASNDSPPSPVAPVVGQA